MRRRHFILGLLLLPLLAGASKNSHSTCPICGGKLVAAGSMLDDESKPSVNLAVWDRSSDGSFYPDSRICSSCYFSYDDTLAKWTRSSEIPTSFFIPLSAAIIRFPLQDRIGGLRTVYSQVFKGVDASQGRSESVAYWCRDSKPLRMSLDSYCEASGLAIEFYTAPSEPGQVFVTAKTIGDLSTPLGISR